jgi:N4-gp56 family major capsid protein
MARTSILSTDPQVRKAWALRVATDSIREQYWARHIGDEGSMSLVVRKTDLEAGAGDEVTTTLVAKLRGAPVISGQKLEGREMKLDFATHKMRVDVIRQGVNVGTKMDQKRVDMNLKKQGRARLTDYIKELYEEHIACAAAGARGVGTAEFQHLDTTYAGYPNALRAPDSQHLFVGSDGSKAKATLATTDLLKLTTLNALAVKAKKYVGAVQDGNAVKLQKISRGGKDVWVLVTMPEGMQDLRNDSGTAGWIDAQRALVTSIGKDAEWFKGGAGYFNGTIVDECEVGVKFSDYGAGGTGLAMRSLFCGANALAVANGTKGMTDGLSIELADDTNDRGYEDVLTFMMIFGVDKTVYTPVNGASALDFGMISVDHAYTLAVGNTI